jgi:hypothetical protein
VSTTAPRCQRCGEVLRASTSVCPTCGHVFDRAHSDDDDSDFTLAGDSGPSSVFLLPRDPPDRLPNRREIRGSSRLKIWIAGGLATVSLIGGLLYYITYLQVGNKVTELLPSDTVAYVQIAPTGKLESAFRDLDLWQTSNPVRDQIYEHEKTLVANLLLDIGINISLVETLKAGITEAHIAVLAPAQRTHLQMPYDVVLFLKFENDQLSEEFTSRLNPFFETVGEENGVTVRVRKSGSPFLSLAQFDDYTAICWGSDAALRRILKNRGSDGSDTLNEAKSFRKAFQDNNENADVWMYVQYNHLVDMILLGLLRSRVKMGRVRSLYRGRRLLTRGNIDGLGVAVRLKSGQDKSEIVLYPEDKTSLKSFARETGRASKETLSAIPHDAVFAAAFTIANIGSLLNRFGEDVFRMAAHLGSAKSLVGFGDRVKALHHAIAQRHGQEIRRVFSGEFAFSLLPAGPAGELAPLLVVKVEKTEEAVELTKKVVTSVYSVGQQKGADALRIDNGKEMSRLIDGSTEESTVHEWLCWAADHSMLLIARQCATVHRALKASRSGKTIGSSSAVSAALKTVTTYNTALLVGRMRSLVQWLYQNKKTSDLIKENFVAAVSVAVHADRIKINSNISPLSLGFLWITANRNRVEPAHKAPSDPCAELVASVCEDVTDQKLCNEWKTKVKGLPEPACATGLRTLIELEKAEL